jgi:hypothetical protein
VKEFRKKFGNRQYNKNMTERHAQGGPYLPIHREADKENERQKKENCGCNKNETADTFKPIPHCLQQIDNKEEPFEESLPILL